MHKIYKQLTDRERKFCNVKKKTSQLMFLRTLGEQKIWERITYKTKQAIVIFALLLGRLVQRNTTVYSTLNIKGPI